MRVHFQHGPLDGCRDDYCRQEIPGRGRREAATATHPPHPLLVMEHPIPSRVSPAGNRCNEKACLWVQGGRTYNRRRPTMQACRTRSSG
eukprot:scaffold177801_cov28-Tisochrysis_lutea.AAC.3